MEIEILVLEGCPNADAAKKLVCETVDELGIEASIEVVYVNDAEDAIARRFLGSPSIRVGGKDLEIEENKLIQYFMGCRIYRHGHRLSGLPPKELVTRALVDVR